MVAETVVSIEKSTNFRTVKGKAVAKKSLAMDLARLAFGVTARVAPDLAIAWVEHAFFTPKRYERPLREVEVLKSARRFTVASAGRQLAVWEWGDGPTVLLVHGWAGRGAQLGALVKDLTARGLHVVAFDGPAHGESEGLQTNLFEHAAAVEDVARTLGGKLFAVVAHSFGAPAVTLALKRSLRTERVVYLAPWSSLPSATRTIARELGVKNDLLERFKRKIEERRNIRWDDLDGRKLAADMRQPLLVIHDEDDAEVPIEEGRTLAAAWPGARYVETHGLGHRRVMWDASVVAQVVDFLTT